MSYDINCPAIAEQFVCLLLAANPFIPVWDSLKPAAFFRSQPTQDNIIVVYNQTCGVIG